MTEPPRAANAVQIGLRVFGKIKVDHYIDRLDIDASSKQIGTDQVPADSVAKIMEYPVAVILEHPGVRIKAGITKFGDLLCQQLDPVR